MAAIVNRISSTPQGTRTSSVARVSAKAAAREKTPRNDDDEIEIEVNDDGDAKPAREAGGTYLSMYFRDMALLDVLRPEEEFTSAREIETLEIMVWECVLA